MHIRTVLTSCKALCSHNSTLNVFWLMRETGWDAVALNIVIQSSHPRLLSMEGSFLLDFLSIHWLSSPRRSVNWCPVKEGCGFSMATRDSWWPLAKPTPDGRLGLSELQDCQSAWGNSLNCIGFRRASTQFCCAFFLIHKQLGIPIYVTDWHLFVIIYSGFHIRTGAGYVNGFIRYLQLVSAHSWQKTNLLIKPPSSWRWASRHVVAVEKSRAVDGLISWQKVEKADKYEAFLTFLKHNFCSNISGVICLRLIL